MNPSVVEKLARRLAAVYNLGYNKGYLMAIGADNMKDKPLDTGWEGYMEEAERLLNVEIKSLIGHLE